MRRRTLLVSATMAWPALRASAQDAAGAYPDRPLHVVVPFPAGGATDVVVRLLSTPLGAALGQPVVVENRSGAAGVVGATAVARARPDGYTLLVGSLGSNLIAPMLMREPPFDPATDFEPVSAIGITPTALLVRAESGITQVADLLAILRREPGRHSYSSAGIGSPMHLSAVLLGLAAGVQAVHVPYRGEAPAITDLIGGQVLFCFAPASSAVSYARGGRLRVLAIAGNERQTPLPEVPTMPEAGLPAVQAYTWQGLFAPRGTPQPIVARLNQAVQQALRDPALQAKAAEAGVPLAGSTVAAFRAQIEADLRKWSEVIQTAGIEKQ